MGQAVAGYGNFMEPCCRHGGEIDFCYQGDGKVANEAVGLKVAKLERIIALTKVIVELGT